MATYFGTSINESPTIVMEVGTEIKGAQGIALMVDGGKVKAATKGVVAIGLSLFTNDENIAVGDDVDIQVKDIGKWVASGTIAVGDLLASDADGKAAKATEGDFVVATALSAAKASGDVIKVQIIKAGYLPAGK